MVHGTQFPKPDQESYIRGTAVTIIFASSFNSVQGAARTRGRGQALEAQVYSTAKLDTLVCGRIVHSFATEHDNLRPISSDATTTFSAFNVAPLVLVQYFTSSA